MRPIALPVDFARFAEIGGALDVHVFEDVGDTPGAPIAAVGAAIAAELPDRSRFDSERLRTLGGTPLIGRAAIFGEWYDPEAKALLKRGEHRTADGRTLTNPRLRDLDHTRLVSGAGAVPDLGQVGQFAYAFADPPYALNARPSEIQALFDAITDHIWPCGVWTDTLDWSDARLGEVSPYFDAGLEWWGAFLFTVHAPETDRLTVILGSTTD